MHQAGVPDGMLAGLDFRVPSQLIGGAWLQKGFRFWPRLCSFTAGKEELVCAKGSTRCMVAGIEPKSGVCIGLFCGELVCNVSQLQKCKHLREIMPDKYQHFSAAVI